MQVGDLIAFYPKSGLEKEQYVGLLLNKETVGRAKLDTSILYDVLIGGTDEVITISDIYFTIWRIE